MRISEVQNFATAAINKCCRPRKSNENIPSSNNLERSPMTDTVSFGRFGGRYAPLTEDYVLDKLIDGDINAYETLDRATYLSIEPTEETIKDPSRHIYKAKLVSCREFRPDFSRERINDCDSTMRMHIKNFNDMHGYSPKWVNSLTTTADFERAAALADYLERHGYIPRGDADEDAWMKNRPFTLLY